jgi:PRTRC genetic system ThiF family protein
MKKTIEKTYSFKLSEDAREAIQRIVIIGAGGNGSHVISDVARLVSTLDWEIKPEIILVDGDTVEEKNLIRQHFSRQDIGKNKAEVLASRYGNAFNVSISYIPEYLTESNVNKILQPLSDGIAYGHGQLIITCTDNLKSRKLIDGRLKGHYWLDLGNEEFGGQVTFSHVPNSWSWGRVVWPPEGGLPLPTVFELFPEYNERLKAEKPVTERSCAEIAEASPVQAGFVNVMAAAIAKNYVHALLTGREIKTYQVFFTIDNTFEHRTMTKSVVEKWIKEIERFKTYDLI